MSFSHQAKVFAQEIKKTVVSDVKLYFEPLVNLVKVVKRDLLDTDPKPKQRRH